MASNEAHMGDTPILSRMTGKTKLASMTITAIVRNETTLELGHCLRLRIRIAAPITVAMMLMVP